MEDAALRAGIHRVTLHRWEKGQAQPRLTELEALLSALNAGAAHRQRALALMDAPRAVRQIRSEVARIAERNHMTSMPHGGELLQTLRMRRRLSLEETARRIQSTAATLSRWENSEMWPSQEQLLRLCYALEAQAEEIIALSNGDFGEPSERDRLSPETVHRRLHELNMRESEPGGYPLFELAFLRLEADAWPQALKSEEGKQMLIRIYAYHSHRLSCRDRLVEAGAVAAKALGLMTGALAPQAVWLFPAIISARARVFRGERPAPRRGIEILRPWLSAECPPEMRAWMLSDIAKYSVQAGALEAALEMGREYCRIAEQAEAPEEVCLRQWDRAALLMQAGQPQKALPLLMENRLLEHVPQDRIDVSLLRAEAYQMLGKAEEAYGWLQQALADLALSPMEHKRLRALQLEAQIVR